MRLDDVVLLGLVSAAQALVDWILGIVVDFGRVLKVTNLPQPQLRILVRLQALSCSFLFYFLNKI